jgi:RNase P subunit RPR2
MGNDQKDRLGEKLHDVEKAREDQYFAERDRALIQKLKAESGGEQVETVKELTRMRCPKCGARLATATDLGVTVEQCPACHGMWFDKGDLDAIAGREKTGWLARFLGR